MPTKSPAPLRAPGSLAAALAAAAVLACAASPSVRASPQPFKPDDRSCHRATPEQLAWLRGDAWKGFSTAVRVCIVRRDARAPAGLLIVSVWEEDYYAKQPNGSTMVEMPRAQLLSPDERLFGELPKNFPIDEAEALKLRFGAWRGNLPGEIHPCVLSPGVAGDDVLPPLRLDAAGTHYDAAAGRPSAPTPKDDCRGQ